MWIELVFWVELIFGGRLAVVEVVAEVLQVVYYALL
jgi:hypothetical protein